jgi:prepilin-type N-terminal cleavage/methylation domain-containing protein/prepilin-type processing-associated H-X9-DG protein
MPIVCARRRGAFTLPEVLVVAAIIGLLAALLTPVLARAIGRGRLTQCMNNQYQLGFALNHYNEKNRAIPGWLHRVTTVATGTSGALSYWTVPLLPFLGRTDLYDSWPLLPNTPSIAVFGCPANRPSKSLGYPLLHYAANVGASGTDWHDGVFLNLQATGARGISLDDIADADGTATTLAFAEKSATGFQPHTWVYLSSMSLQGSLFGSGTSKPPVFGVAAGPVPTPPIINIKATNGVTPHSDHVGGAVVAFCDGHTALLSGTIQPYEYAQLLTPKSRWQRGVNKTNTPAMDLWLRTNGRASGEPYLLDEKILK